MAAQFGNFSRPAAAGAPPAVRSARFAGIQEPDAREEIPHEGTYRFLVLDCAEVASQKVRSDASVHARLRIVALDEEGQKHHKVGDVVKWIRKITGDSELYGLPAMKTFMRFAAGYDDPQEFQAFDPNGEFLEACLGYSNAYSQKGHGIVGRYFDARVRRGNDVIDKRTGVCKGDFYREYDYAVVPEEEQEVPRGMRSA